MGYYIIMISLAGVPPPRDLYCIYTFVLYFVMLPLTNVHNLIHYVFNKEYTWHSKYQYTTAFYRHNTKSLFDHVFLKRLLKNVECNKSANIISKRYLFNKSQHARTKKVIYLEYGKFDLLLIS